MVGSARPPEETTIEPPVETMELLGQCRLGHDKAEVVGEAVVRSRMLPQLQSSAIRRGALAAVPLPQASPLRLKRKVAAWDDDFLASLIVV
jgi:hypothetical protein